MKDYTLQTIYLCGLDAHQHPKGTRLSFAHGYLCDMLHTVFFAQN